MLAPPRFQINFFEDGQNRKIRYGFSLPDGEPKALVTILEGRAEPLEKYAELIEDLNENGYACAIMDWPGQGKSYRNLPDFPQRHDTPSYDELVKTLGIFRKQIIPTLIPQSAMPHILFGQSMGGHLGMLYVADNPDDYVCAVFSAPMIRFHPIPRRLPKLIENILVAWGARGDPENYFSGGRDWSPLIEVQKYRYLTSDENRRLVLTQLFEEDEELRVGNWTKRTLREAFESGKRLQKETIETPSLILLGSKDTVINNAEAKAFAAKQPHMQVIEIDGALHELYMEKDEYRDQFMNHTLSFINHHCG